MTIQVKTHLTGLDIEKSREISKIKVYRYTLCVEKGAISMKF
jgi:hypothetical protein